MDEEIWKDIEGYEGLYQISNFGRIKSLNFKNTGLPKIMKNGKSWCGQSRIKLHKNTKERDFIIARLVANAFLENPLDQKCVFHKDGDMTNNRVENLMWVDKSEIQKKMYVEQKKKREKKEIIFNGKKFKNLGQIAKFFGIDTQLFYRRIHNGWTIKEAILTPATITNRVQPKKYDFYGKDYTVKQLSKMSGKTEKLIFKRLNQHWNIYESVEIPISIKKKKEKIKNGV